MSEIPPKCSARTVLVTCRISPLSGSVGLHEAVPLLLQVDFEAFQATDMSCQLILHASDSVIRSYDVTAFASALLNDTFLCIICGDG